MVFLLANIIKEMLHNKGLILLLYRFQITYFDIFLLLNLGDPVPDIEGFQIAGNPTWIYTSLVCLDHIRFSQISFADASCCIDLPRSTGSVGSFLGKFSITADYK
jgi:hypothetical protein